jgi:hypothetical protein
MRTVISVIFCALACSTSFSLETENVILITLDGLRWQELFGGADENLVHRSQGVGDVVGLAKTYLRDTPKESREVLMPFFWSVIAQKGIVYGDPGMKSEAHVTNDQVFSYPGYNEILTGFADANITSNAKKYNENVTVLEWLNRKEAYKGKVAAFGSWDVFPFIVNDKRSGIPVNAGWMDLDVHSDDEQKDVINRLQRETPHFWAGVRWDNYTHQGALEYLKVKKPRVLYIAYGETDDWAHAREFDMYLDAALRSDRYIQEIWETAQSMPEYAGKTSLVITTDHGRGPERKDWISHGSDTEGSKRIWIAVMGPDTPAAGSVNGKKHTQSQVAATVAALLGEDYREDQPRAGKPLPKIIK